MRIALLLAVVVIATACEGPLGPQGPSGEQGRQGEQGRPGEPGTDGQNGQDGQDGQDGAAGQQGAVGRDAETTEIYLSAEMRQEDGEDWYVTSRGREARYPLHFEIGFDSSVLVYWRRAGVASGGPRDPGPWRTLPTNLRYEGVLRVFVDCDENGLLRVMSDWPEAVAWGLTTVDGWDLRAVVLE